MPVSRPGRKSGIVTIEPQAPSDAELHKAGFFIRRGSERL
jgi:hypothetical protein